MPNVDNYRQIIEREVLGEDCSAFSFFVSHFKDEIFYFIDNCTIAFSAWHNFTSKFNKTKRQEFVGCFLLFSLNSLLVSSKLLFHGYLSPSGNMMRQCLESIAMATWCAHPSLLSVERVENDKFSASKAMNMVLKNANKLGIEKKSHPFWKNLKTLYDKYSHATYFGLATIAALDDPGKFLIGASFDPAKLPQYKKEIDLRIQVAKDYKNIMSGIEAILNKPHL